MLFWSMIVNITYVNINNKQQIFFFLFGEPYFRLTLYHEVNASATRKKWKKTREKGKGKNDQNQENNIDNI